MALAADRAVSEPLRRCWSLRALRRFLSFTSVRAHLLNWWCVRGWLLCGRRCTQWVDRRWGEVDVRVTGMSNDLHVGRAKDED